MTSYKFRDTKGTGYYVSNEYRKRDGKRSKEEVCFGVLMACCLGVLIAWRLLSVS